MRAIPEAKERYSELIESFKVLIESGLICVGMGGESGSDIVNKILYKGITTDDVKYTYSALKSASRSLGTPVDFALYMMYPTTTQGLVKHEVVFKENISFVKVIEPTSVVLAPLAAFCGAEVFERKEEYGIEVDEHYNELMPSFEYTTYLPKEFWRKIDYKIEGLSFEDILVEVMNLTREFRALGVQTDMTDEQVIFARIAGFDGTKGLTEFYSKTVNDLISCSQKNLKEMYQQFNKKSREIASQNF